MKSMVSRILPVLALVLASVSVAGVSLAADAASMGSMNMDVNTSAGPVMMQKMEQPEEVGNKYCPICGMAIEEDKAVKVVYKGKIYNVCSAADAEAFNKDPEAAVKKLEAMNAEEKSEAGDDDADDVKEDTMMNQNMDHMENK